MKCPYLKDYCASLQPVRRSTVANPSRVDQLDRQMASKIESDESVNPVFRQLIRSPCKSRIAKKGGRSLGRCAPCRFGSAPRSRRWRPNRRGEYPAGLHHVYRRAT